MCHLWLMRSNMQKRIIFLLAHIWNTTNHFFDPGLCSWDNDWWSRWLNSASYFRFNRAGDLCNWQVHFLTSCHAYHRCSKVTRVHNRPLLSICSLAVTHPHLCWQTRVANLLTGRSRWQLGADTGLAGLKPILYQSSIKCDSCCLCVGVLCVGVCVWVQLVALLWI